MALFDKGGSDSITTTGTTSPPAFQIPYLMRGLQGAQSYLDSPLPQQFPFSTVTPFAQEQEQALGMTAGRARAGSPITRTAQTELGRTLGGEYLNANPYLDATFKRAADAVGANIDSRFNLSNRFGSGAHQNVMGQTFADLATNIYGGNYANERNKQMQAMMMAPQIGGMDYADLDRLAGVGGQRQALGQAQLSDAQSRWGFEQTRDLQKLRDFMAMVRGDFGQQTTATQPTFRNPVAGGIGGAATGLGLGLGINQLSPGTIGGAQGISPWLLPLLGGGLGFFGS